MDSLNLKQIMEAKYSNFDNTFGSDSKIIVYGCGAQAQELLENCPRNEQILCVSDGKRSESEFMGYPFYSFHELKKFGGGDYKIAITSFKYFEEIKEELLKVFDEDKILPYTNWQTRIHYNFSRKDYNQWILEHSKQLQDIYALLADEASKKALLHILLGLENVSAAEWMNTTMISQFNLVNYFDNQILKLSEHEKFVDVGAYDGDTVQEFLRITQGKYDKIWAYEPDEEVFSVLQKKVDELHDDRIICKREGLGKESGYIGFIQNENKFLSRLSENDGDKVRISTIDDIDDATYIKICVRGMNNTIDVLEGARKSCMKNRPKLAIVIGLTDDGIFEIPNKIIQLNPDYKIYYRLTAYPQAYGQKISACYFAV